MRNNKIGLLGEPKYRICKCPGPKGKKIVFFCDWDYIHPPKATFLGKPIYFQQIETAGLPFQLKEIEGGFYLDLLKLKPHNLYICDLGLKLICENLAPGLLIDNSRNVLQTLCLVPMDSVIQERYSIFAKEQLLFRNETFSHIFNSLEDFLGDGYEFGVIGYHALNPLYSDTELDLVIIADTIERLNLAKKKIDEMLKIKYSTYILEMWPLSKRTTDIGSLDFFYSTRNSCSQILSELERATILEWAFEFESTIIDESAGILGTPMWKTENNFHLIGIDNALRGRFQIGDRVTGIGIYAIVKNEKIIIIQSARNISFIVHRL